MKKTVLILIFLTMSVWLLAQTRATVKMLNGDEIPCSIMTDTLDLVTDYGELSFETKYIKTIQFPEPGKGYTVLNTLFGETFRGFITNDVIRLNVYGSEMEIRKAKINNITFLNEAQQATDFKITVSLRNGDAFYATPADSIINIQTSYGEVKLPFENMSEISFEGFGNVLTKIKMKDGGTLQGIIKDDYIPINLLSEIELEVVPDLMKEIKFSRPEKNTSVHKEEPDNVKTESLKKNELNQNTSFPKSEIFVTSNGIELVFVEKGEFQMGNTRNDNEGKADESPVHDVIISYDFYIGKNEVTFDVYDQYSKERMKTLKDDKGWGRDKYPVLNISFIEATEFCNWLSKKEGLNPAYDKNGNLLNMFGKSTRKITEVEGYRLPTEAEWEYAARGGHQSIGDFMYPGSNELSELGWYNDNSDKQSHEVCLKKGNEIGLFDMSGNVREWCTDYYSASYYQLFQTYNPYNATERAFRVVRGGSYLRSKDSARISSRSYFNENYSSSDLGFRIAKTKIK